MKKPVYIGRYCLFGSPIVFEGVEGREGNGYSGWTPTSYLRVEIGLDGEWNEVLEIALHEVTEFGMILAGCGLKPFRFLGRKDASMYHYYINHEQFTEVMQNVAEVMQYLLPELKRVWLKREWKKKGRGK